MGLLRQSIVNQESFEIIYTQDAIALLDGLEHLFEQVATFFDGEERLLIGVDQNGNDYFVEEFAATLDDVEVTVGNWIE